MSFELRSASPEDDAALLRALRVHAPGCAAVGSFSDEAQLAWLRAAPAGSRSYLALDGDEVVAHVAAVPHVVWMNGARHRFAELVAGFAAPRTRAGLGRSGVFTRLAKRLFQEHQGVEGDFVYYGWPGTAEWRLGKQSLGYRIVCTPVTLARPTDAAPAAEPDAVRELSAFDHQAMWLWERCAGALGASIIRDDTFLNHRFMQRPGHAYTALGYFDVEDILRGYAIFAVGAWQQAHVGLVCDWLVPADEPEVGEALLQALDVRAQRAGVLRMEAVLPDGSPWFDRFQCHGFRASETGQRLIARTTARKFDAYWLSTQWWYTLADTVLV